MWRKVVKSVSKMQTYWFVLAVYCFAHVFCSQIKSAAVAAESHSHHHHHQQQRHLNPAGNSEANIAGTTKKQGHSSGSNFKSKLPWNAPEQGIEKHNKDVEQGSCRYKRCGAGRECIVSSSSGQAKCSCIKNCKKEGKSNKPVCGTDGRLYPSYCDLRRTACLTGAHIFFSHYQHQQQEKHHHHQQHHDEVYHQGGSYQHRQRDFSFGIGSGSRNGSTTLSQHRNNIIPSRRDFGANQDPQCFPFIQPHHHSYQYNHRYHHHHSHYHNDPDKNPLRDKNQGSLQPQSPLQPSTTLQHSKFSRNDEIHSAEYELDDADDDVDGDDEQDEHNYQDSRSVSSIGTTRTATIAASLTLGENGDDLRDEAENYDQNVYDENHDDYYDSDADDNENDGISPAKEKIGNSKVGRTAMQHQHHHHHSHHQDFTIDYPDGIIGPQKKRKISSRPTNGRVDSRHISERSHSDMPASSYYDFMELNKDGKPKEEEEGMKGKASDINSNGKTVSSWGKQEDEVDDEMSSQALFLGDGVKSSETLEPSAATNLEWKLLQQEEISGGNGKEGTRRNSNGHWDDPVKKSSSFVRAGHKTDDEHGKEYAKSERSFSKREGSAADSFRSTISHNSARVSSSTLASPRHNVCSPQDYEILKAELFQYDMSKLMNHIKLMTSVSNDAVVADDDNDNASGTRKRVDADDAGRYPREARSSGDAPWSDERMMTATTSSPPPPWLNMEGDGPEADKDNLLRHIFTLLDRNHDSVLEYIELYKAEMEGPLELYSPEKTSCQFRDFLLFDDTNEDGQLAVNEFFSSFSHFYDITMISLDKALETKQTRVVEGDTVVLRCDITGSPPPYIQWKRYGTGLSQYASLGIRSNIDGTLSLTNVHMIHAGHYSCESPRNPEVVQTHIVEVETQPQVVIAPKASWKRPGEDLLLICRLVLPITDSSSVKEIATGHSVVVAGSVNWIWLFNGVPLRELPKSDNNNNNKYIFENSSSEDSAGISRLRLREIYFQDMGSYSCQAENVAGIGSASASLVVIDPNSKPEVQALHNANAKQLLVFHRNGLASYSAENCGWLWEIFGDDVLQPSVKEGKDVARAVCDQFHSLCNWGKAVQVSPNFVYVAQPSQGRVFLIDVGAVQSVGNAIGIIQTCANINSIEYVSYTDQLWIRCEVDHDKRQTVLFNVVENASKGDHHKAIQFQFPFQRRDTPGGEGPVRITEIYLPSHQDGRRGKKDCQFAFVSLSDEQSLQRIDLKTFTYHKNGYLNLTKFSCIPHQIHFSLSCTISIINCLDPKSKTPNGQVVVDTLSNSVRYKTTEISGISIVSSDDRILLTEKHVENNTHLFVQRIGVYEINLLSHFLLSNHYTNIRVVHSTLTGAYASVAKLPTGKEAVISLQTGEIQSVDDLLNMVPHSSRATTIYPADSAFPLKTEKSVIVMDAETLRPRCKFYEEIPELQSFLTVKS